MDIARVVAVIVGSLFAVVAFPLVIGFLIAGLWEGFTDTKFTLGFLAFAIYVLATTGLSFFYAARKPAGLGWVLAVLYVPAIISLVWLQRSEQQSKRDQAVADSFIAAGETADMGSVTEPLARIVETESDPDVIDELIQTLETSEDLHLRLRIVRLFRDSSPPNGLAHMALRNLYRKMAERGGLEELRTAVREAILAIDPDDQTYVDALDRLREERSR